jgi:hypothetical protein
MTTLSDKKHQACQLFISGFFPGMMNLSIRRALFKRAQITDLTARDINILYKI